MKKKEQSTKIKIRKHTPSSRWGMWIDGDLIVISHCREEMERIKEKLEKLEDRKMVNPVETKKLLY